MRVRQPAAVQAFLEKTQLRGAQAKARVEQAVQQLPQRATQVTAGAP